jgi:hypothetical protein
VKDTLIRLSSKPAEHGVCKGCGRPILWLETLTGKRMPMNDYAMPRHVGHDSDFYDASDSHWASCPAKSRFERKAQPHA